MRQLYCFNPLCRVLEGCRDIGYVIIDVEAKKAYKGNMNRAKEICIKVGKEFIVFLNKRSLEFFVLGGEWLPYPVGQIAKRIVYLAAGHAKKARFYP
ncbi:MAG: hypothetical protein ABWW69_05590 [Pyrodictiaceae archaeon]